MLTAFVDHVRVFLGYGEFNLYGTVVFDVGKNRVNRDNSPDVCIDHPNLSVERGRDPGLADRDLQFSDLSLEYPKVGGGFIIVLLGDGVVCEEIFEALLI